MDKSKYQVVVFITEWCPFCIQMFEDGVPSVQPEEEGRIKPFDVAELLETAIFGPASAEVSETEQ